MTHCRLVTGTTNLADVALVLLGSELILLLLLLPGNGTLASPTHHGHCAQEVHIVQVHRMLLLVLV